MPTSGERREVEELKIKKEDLQKALHDLEVRKQELLRLNEELEVKMVEAEAKLAKKVASEEVEVEVELGLEVPRNQGSFPRPLSSYYADLDAELALPSYPLSFLEGFDD